MAKAADLRALEDSCPWLRDEFQSDIARLSGSTAAAARSYAEDNRTLARLISLVPRCDDDERGATPWTSFRREVAVARRVSDQAAAAEIRIADLLTSALPRTMELLEAGGTTVARARAFALELLPYTAEVAEQLDAELADRAAQLPVSRMKDAVRRAVAKLDPDALAAREARKTADRGVLLQPDADGQASLLIFGPAVPLTRMHATLDARARALKAAGDPRTLDALRFDLATSTFPCSTHAPADPTADGDLPAAAAPAAAGLRPSGIEPAGSDCRMSRPVAATILVPVETSLGLSNEPGWLEGYGWLSAPTVRQLLVDAELRRACAQTGTGVLVDLAAGWVRPPPTPAGLRDALLTMVLEDAPLSDVGWRTEPRHDPSDRLRDFVNLRDRFCDGPTGARVPAARADLDHDVPYPAGPTAAWNLVARGRRTHLLKHDGWTPLRTAAGTMWLSPAGQLVEVSRHVEPPPGIDAGPGEARLPDPDELALMDRLQLTSADLADSWPMVPRADRISGDWQLLEGSAPIPF